MNCPICGTVNQPGAKFCVECGTKLAAACPTCGTANQPGAKFCVECGTNLGAGTVPPATAAETPAASASAVPAGSERRLVSVLFADLVGSTTLAEDRDPEESRELLSRYFDLASEVIGQYGGSIEKFIGDAVMAVWGVPAAHEDDAERAVRAALDLVTAVGGLTDAASGQALSLRAAVLTGEAAATIGAHGQGMVAGDLVNTASRLQSVAPPGSVLVGESTWRATSGAIAYEEAGEQVLKGKTAPIAAWRAQRVLGLRGGGGRRVALEAPFVGRDDELRLLKDLFHATANERKPRLVTVVGQAGIGKSRLGWEFEKYLDGVTQTAYWHAGRSPSYGEGISFWALAEMVRERAGIAELDDPAAARQKLTAEVAEWVTDPEERRWVEPRLAGLLGLEEMPDGQREELFAAWRTFFERIAAQDPVILVFKDLHWADSALLEFIEHVLTWSRDYPIFVVAMTRPDLFERHPTWGGATVRNATTITLEPLPVQPMRELLEGLVPGLPEDAVSSIVDRAEGVPLYAVETVRMLIDTGQVVASDDGYALSGPMPKLAVPETLQALVAARIDANDPADRSTLADAAVLGQSFTLAGLAGVTGADEATVETSLDRLVKRELLIRDDDPRSPERGQYRFVQAIVREIAYETLSKKDRRAKHLAAARYFEALGEDELAGVLASHYLEAYRSTPPGPEADALAVQARIALRAAADRASALHSWTGTQRHLTDAIEIASEPSELAALYLARAEVRSLLADVEAVQDALTAADLAVQLGDRGTENSARAVAGRIYVNDSKGAEALAVLEPAVASLGEDEPNAAPVFGELARIYMMLDRSEESVAMAERALRAAGPNRDAEVVVNALVSRGSAISFTLGRFDEAEAMIRGAIVLADRAGTISAGLRARNNLVSSLLLDAPLTSLLPIMNEGVEIALRYGMAGWGAQHVLARAVAEFAIGDWDAARSDVAIVADWTLADVHAGWRAGLRARLAAAAGDEARVHESVAEVTERMQRIDTKPQLTELAVDIGQAHVLLGHWSAALRALEGFGGGGNDALILQWSSFAAAAAGDPRSTAAINDRTEILDTLHVAQAIRRQLAASAAATAARWDEAQREYPRAIAELKALDMNLEASMVGLEFAAYLGDRFEDARSAGESAGAWFRDRDAASVVERYRENFTGTPAPPAAGTGPARRAVAVDPAVETEVDAEQRA